MRRQRGRTRIHRHDDLARGPGRERHGARRSSADRQHERHAVVFWRRRHVIGPAVGARARPGDGLEDHCIACARQARRQGRAGQAGISPRVRTGFGVAFAAKDRLHHTLQACGESLRGRA